MLKKLCLLLMITALITSQGVVAQVAINPSGASADQSAVLDLNHTSKGFLIPRMSTAERVAISDPARGLIVLDTTSMAFFYYDGSSRWIQLATGTVSYDTTGNEVIFGQNIIFSDTVEIYDDLRIPVNSLKVQGSINQPDWNIISSITGTLAAYHFDPDALQQLFFVVQMPHRYMPGTVIYPHIHWLPSSANSGDVRWGLEYTWANIGGTFGSTATVTGLQSVNLSEQNKHMMTALGQGIDGSNRGESSMIICRMFRDATYSGDTYPDDAVLLEVDFHYRVEKLGEEFNTNQ